MNYSGMMMRGVEPAKSPAIPFARKLAALAALTPQDLRTVEACATSSETRAPHIDLMVEGTPVKQVYLVEEGWALRYKLLSDGQRQILDFVLPGDMIGFRAAFLGQAHCSVQTLTPVTVAPLSLDQLFGATAASPRMLRAFASSCAMDARVMAEHLVSLGRRAAYGRLAYLVLELYARLAAIGRVEGGTFRLPLTQEILADALGLSIVHVNRTLRKLRDEGVMTLSSQRVVIHDFESMMRIADFPGDGHGLLLPGHGALQAGRA